MAKTFLVMPGYIPRVSHKDGVAKKRGRSDFFVLADTIRDKLGNEVEFLDYGTVKNDPRLWMRTIHRLCGLPIALAVAVFFRLQEAESVYSFGETAAVPLGLLSKLLPKRPVHVGVALHLKKNLTQISFRRLSLHRQIDTLIVLCEAHRKCAVDELSIPAEKLKVVPCFVDAQYYRPQDAQRGDVFTVASAGSTNRDYVTLCRAAKELPEVAFKIVPTGHPLRLRIKAIPDMPIPNNVSFLEFEPGALREFYAPCDVVAVSVHEGQTVAGATTLLEAMAMEKAVIATRSQGLADFVIDGETGLTVEPRDVEGWKTAISRLRHDAALRERLGRNARQWVTSNASVEIWADTITTALGAAVSRPFDPRKGRAQSEAG